MVRLVVDAMGGDNGSAIVVEACKEFLKKNKDVELAVCGKLDELKELEGLCRLVEANDVVPMQAGALQVMRMRNSSMMVALNLCKTEGYDGVVSCGSTGGFLSAATIVLKPIPGVKRAALVTGFPTKNPNKKVTLLDVGASNENSPEELLQFGLMGSLYNEAVNGVKDPKVYILSNGVEEGKGSPVGKEAYKLYKETNFQGFMGNIEAREVLSGDADVVVCDGFTGNVFLKGVEGAAKMMGGLMKAGFKKNLLTKIGYLFAKSGMDDLQRTMDYKTVGGAMLLGINGAVLKAHGNSDAYSFRHALILMTKLVKLDVVNRIKEGVAKNE